MIVAIASEQIHDFWDIQTAQFCVFPFYALLSHLIGTGKKPWGVKEFIVGTSSAANGLAKCRLKIAFSRSWSASARLLLSSASTQAACLSKANWESNKERQPNLKPTKKLDDIRHCYGW